MLVDIPTLLRQQNYRKADHRGFFERVFDHNDLGFKPLQVNISTTQLSGTVRGLHLLKGKHSETKAVKVTKGRIFDCSVNLNKGSVDFGKVFCFEMEESDMVLIPKFYAHGFQSLSDDTRIIYAVDNIYEKHADSGISPLFKGLVDLWPLKITHLSKRDSQLTTDITSTNFVKCDFC